MKKIYFRNQEVKCLTDLFEIITGEQHPEGIYSASDVIDNLYVRPSEENEVYEIFRIFSY